MQIGLTDEAANELEKAETMEPGLVGPTALQQATAQRNSDPKIVAAQQMQREAKVGLDASHPVYIINALIKEQPQPQTPLQALRLGLEYSKLADDDQAGRYLHIAEQMSQNPALAPRTETDAGWASVIYDPLEQNYRVSGASAGEEEVRASLEGASTILRRPFLLPLRPGRSGRYYYVTVVEVETLSLSDLEELRRWLRGDLAPVVAGERDVESAVARGFRRLVVRALGLPARRVRVRTPTFEVGEPER